MDDIQFWVYLVFGLIYFVTRALRKKKPEEEYQESDPSTPHRPQNRPKSFEELLREFTEGPADEPEEQEVVPPARSSTVIRKVDVAKPEQDSQSSRRFADDESRKVYEESIKMAEGADLKFERNEHFRSGIKRRERDEKVPDNSIGKEILASLKNSDEAKKAVVLAEILNRRY